jgi:hypothetical protein
LIGLAALPLLAGAKTPPPTTPDPLAGTRQLVVVVPADWDAPQARCRRGGAMRPAGSRMALRSTWRSAVPAAPGAGPASGAGRRPAEAGRRWPQPAGVFALGSAFGYAGRPDGAMPYQPMLEDSYCMDVPASPFYNRIVDAKRSAPQRSRAPPSRCGWTCTTRATCATAKAS